MDFQSHKLSETDLIFLTTNTFSKKYKNYIIFFRCCGFLNYYSSSWLKNVFRVIYLFFTVTSFISFMIYLKTLTMGQSLGTITLKSLFLVNLFTVLASIAQTEFCEKQAKNLVGKFDEIDFVIQTKLLMKINFAKDLKFTRNTVLVAFYIFLVVSVIVLAQAYPSSGNYHVVVLRKIAGTLIFVRCLQLCFFLQIMNFRILIVNEAIKKMTMNPNTEILKIAKNIHEKIWKCCQLINSCFGWSTLVIVSAFFIDFALYGYFLVLYMMTGTARITYGEIFGNACPKLIALVIICNAISNCQENMSNMARLIHKLDRRISEKNTSKILRELSMQIYQEPLRFSLSGFFDIDYEFLGSMFIGVATYLVIMVQFQQEEGI